MRDFQNKYLASYIGLPWAFLQPVITIIVIWFAVSVGLRAGPVDTGVSYGLWLILGLVPWFFISDSVITGTNSMLELSYLIKNINFRAGIIPMIKIITAFLIHIPFILILSVFSVAYGFNPSIYWLQIPYYLVATILLVLGITWLTSSITVFVRDIGQLTSVIMGVLFWATPIIWHQSILQGKMSYLATFNPFFYILNGYRNSFLNQAWFFESLNHTIYFWCVTGFIFVIGALVFQKLKPHFADVL